MTIIFTYADMISEIRAACKEHISGSASADDVQQAVQRGEMTIVAVEEREVREFLMDVEGKLELIKFTVDNDKQLQASREVAANILEWLSQWEARGEKPFPVTTYI